MASGDDGHEPERRSRCGVEASADRRAGGIELRRASEESGLQSREVIAHRIHAQVGLGHGNDRGTLVLVHRAVEHELLIAGQREFQQESAKTAAGLDGREQAPAGHVQALEHSLEQERHLVDEPVGLAVLEQEPVVIEHRIHVTGGPDHPGPQGQLVGPQMQDDVVELARNREWPECASPGAGAVGITRGGFGRDRQS